MRLCGKLCKYSVAAILYCGWFSQISSAQEDPTKSQPAQPPRPTSSSPSPSMSASKSAESSSFGGPIYGSVELRHHFNSYYDRGGYLLRREPSAHARLQIGTRLYGNFIDAYFTLGVYKVPQTQQLSQRRPEFAVDVYPVQNDYFSLLWYNLLQAPFNAADQPLEDLDRDDPEQLTPQKEGTVITTGIAPVLKAPVMTSAGRFVFKGGLDGWTKYYSRRQYTNIPTTQDSDDDSHSHFGLNQANSKAIEIEDYAQHYGTQGMLGIGYSPAVLPPLMLDLGVFYDSRYDPIYAIEEGESPTYSYFVERYSHYRARLQYQLSSRTTLTNDFYYFRDGLFAGERYDDDRRYRNIARVSWRM